MYSIADLKDEINAKINWLIANNGSMLHPNWITQAVMEEHPDIMGKDADFHICCSRIHVRKEVSKLINKIESEIGIDNQLKLKGFEELQRYYVVIRDSDRVAVKIENLSFAEIISKAEEYFCMGKACLKHGEELMRYAEFYKATA